MGLKYAPDKEINKSEVYIDLQKFMRKLNLKTFFAHKGETQQQKPTEFKHTTLRNNSVFNPKVPGRKCLGAFRKWWKKI